MRRLVYSPKVNAYVKADSGVIDITPYIVRGQVNRKANQVSSASVTFRNPQVGPPDNRHLLWTEFKDPNTGVVGPCFHPMDPIIITLTRLRHKEIQVFTGYCDTTPYYQMYPGVCTIEASCTLKRLMYTYWDPGLPFVWQWLTKHGWKIYPQGGGLSNFNEENKLLDNTKGAITDSGLGSLLYAIITEVGGWPDETVYIEKIPQGVVERVAKLYQEFVKGNKQAEDDFHEFLHQMIGTSSQGSGLKGAGGNDPSSFGSGSVDPKKFHEWAYGAFQKYGIEPAILGGVAKIESDFGANRGPSSAGAEGLMQFLPSTASGYGLSDPMHDDEGSVFATAHYLKDLGALTNGYRYALEGYNAGPANRSAGAGYASSVLSAADNYKWMDKAPSGSSSTTDSSASPDPNLSSSTKTPSGTASSSYVDPFKDASGVSFGRIDAGVDWSGSGAIVAIGNGKVTYRGTETGSGAKGGNGPFLIYELTDGDHAGKRIFIAENHSPTVNAGDTVKAGQKISELSGGIEMGWAGKADQNWSTQAHENEGYTYNDTESQAGKDFGAFLNSVGRNTPGAAGSSAAGPGTAGGAAGANPNDAKAAAFATFIDVPGLFDTFESMSLRGQKSLMNDQALFPFVQQLCQASLRNFQTMPNGNFYAFFPDYFGGLSGSRTPYWHIEDIEVLDGNINLSDDALATHVYTVGDTANFDGVNIVDKIQTSGVVTVFNAFAADFLNGTPDSGSTQSGGGKAGSTSTGGKVNVSDARTPSLADKNRAIAFLRKYGARPYYHDYPMIRSPIYESFMAYQTFCLMWAQQFVTTFEFTFMPELYPGGLVAFPSHGIQMYIDEVVHTFDYESGFTTQANLMAPTATTGDSNSPVFHAGMIRAFPGYNTPDKSSSDASTTHSNTSHHQASTR